VSESVHYHNQRKYIVFESSLLELFQCCPICTNASEGIISDIKGTWVKVTQRCTDSNCNYERVWTNHKYAKTMPVGNLLLSAAILLSGLYIQILTFLNIHTSNITHSYVHFIILGCATEKTLRMFKFMNIACISRATFYRHASSYINPIVIQSWRNEQESLFQQMKNHEEGLILAGDGRCDSPGYCAKFGSYTVIEQHINRVLDFQLVQVCIQKRGGITVNIVTFIQ